jgi:hypothetical protein
MWKTKLHTHTKEHSKITFLYMLIFTFLDIRWEDLIVNWKAASILVV